MIQLKNINKKDFKDIAYLTSIENLIDPSQSFLDVIFLKGESLSTSK